MVPSCTTWGHLTFHRAVSGGASGPTWQKWLVLTQVQVSCGELSLWPGQGRVVAVPASRDRSLAILPYILLSQAHISETPPAFKVLISLVDNQLAHPGGTARGCVPGRILGAFSREAQGCLGVRPPQSSAFWEQQGRSWPSLFSGSWQWRTKYGHCTLLP